MPTRTFDITVNHVQWEDDRAHDEATDGLGVQGTLNSRIFMKFNTNWADMVDINSADLHIRTGPINSGADVSIRSLLSGWTAGTLTWATMPGTANANIHSVTGTNSWKTLDITSIINAYAPVAAGGSNDPNHGLMIRLDDEGLSEIIGFYSIQMAGNEPYITVNYDENDAPNAPTLTEPDNEEIVNDTTPNFEFTHNDPNSDPISAYQVQVRIHPSASDWSDLTWNSTKTSTGDETPSVTCGVTLVRGSRYFFRARTWDSHDAAGAWTGGRAFTIASLPTATVTSPGTDTIAPLYYVAGSDSTPKFQPTWSFSCAEGGSQTSASVKVYDEAGSSLLHTHPHSGSAQTAQITGFSPTNGTKYQISVTPTCSHGAVGNESAKKRCRVRWGRAAYRADLGAAPVSLSVAVQSTLNSGQIVMEYASHSAATPEPTDWKADIAEVTKQQYIWHRPTMWGQIVAAPTSPQLLSVVFTYSANALTPDNWSLATIGSIDVGTYVYGTQSLKHAADGTDKVSTQVLPVVTNTDYILSGRIKTQGTPGASIELYDAAGTVVVANVAATSDTDWTRYQTPVWNSGSNNSVTVRVRTQGTGTAWFDALKVEASKVVTPWTPGFLGQAVTLDAGGVMIDGQAGGVFRLRGTTGGSRDTVELGTTGLLFGGDALLHSTNADTLSIDGQFVGLRESALQATRITSNQSIPNSAATVVIYNSVVREDDEEADLSLNTSTGVVTVARAGWYLVTGSTRWANNTTGNRNTWIQHNGNNVARSSVEAGGEQWYQSVSGLVFCAASDTLNIACEQDSGAALDLVVSLGLHFGVARIRP